MARTRRQSRQIRGVLSPEVIEENEDLEEDMEDMKSSKAEINENEMSSDGNGVKDMTHKTSYVEDRDKELGRKALDIWIKRSEFHRSQTHVSLNRDNPPIVWINYVSTGVPSQRPYNQLEEQSIESTLPQSDNSEEVVNQRTGHNVTNDIIERKSDDSGLSSLRVEPTVGQSVLRQKGFMFSGFDDKSRSDLTEIVTDLDSCVITSNTITDSTTHLVIKNPFVTEKLLSAITKGVFIISEHYLKDCLKEKRFVSEEEYDWSLYFSGSQDPERSSQTRCSLLKSALLWRQFLSETNKSGVFDGNEVLVINSTQLTQSYARILTGSKAQVVFADTSLLYNKSLAALSRFDFALIDLNDTKRLAKESRPFITKLVLDEKLFLVEYIVSYLMSGPNPSPNQFNKYLITKNHLIKWY